MSAVGLESIDHTVQLTHIWINVLSPPNDRTRSGISASSDELTG